MCVLPNFETLKEFSDNGNNLYRVEHPNNSVRNIIITKLNMIAINIFIKDN